MTYYDTIARQWHAATGYAGGAFKELVLNEVLIGKLPPPAGRAILELGAGNGYFLPLVLRRFGGQSPARIVISDQSERLLSIARQQFNIAGAEYLKLDVRERFPCADGEFDLVIASMLFNEVSERGLRSALGECRRVLANEGLLLITVLHPEFVNSLLTGGALRREPELGMTMPGAGRLRLPVVIRSEAAYHSALAGAGFRCEAEPVFATEAVRSARPGLRNAGTAPIALVFTCRAATAPPP